MKPTNFSWMIEGLLAGCGFPRQVADLNYLTEKGIKHLVSLTHSNPPVEHSPGKFGISVYLL